MEGAKLVPAPLSEASFASITDEEYFLVGVCEQPARIFLAQNFTDQLLFFSMNGADNNFVLPPNGFLLVDFATNKGTPNTAALPSGDGLYVKAPTTTFPTVGSVYMSYWYAS
jgi:hypothetical protein